MKHRYIFLFAILTLAAVSCGKQDTVYKEFVKPGGYIYPAKPLNLTALSGYQRIFLAWEAPMDPSIRTTRLYWDNYTDSLTFSISDYEGGVLEAMVDGLDDRSYTFDVVNFDANGNRSLATEITMIPFGESWLASHSERSVRFARMSGTDALITLSKSTDEMVATRFRYKTEAGQTVISGYLMPDGTDITLPGAKKGVHFEYQSAYLPDGGRDTVWASWTRSMDPIVYPLPTENWTVTVTDDQTFGNYSADKIFDGVAGTNNRWHSSRSGTTSKIFPKILSVDTGEGGDGGLAFLSFEFYLSPSGSTYRYIRDVSVYMGDKPFDPNETDVAGKFGEAAFSATLNRADEVQAFNLRSSRKARYIAIVFTNSWNVNGYIDLWELIPYGFIPSEAD